MQILNSAGELMEQRVWFFRIICSNDGSVDDEHTRGNATEAMVAKYFTGPAEPDFRFSDYPDSETMFAAHLRWQQRMLRTKANNSRFLVFWPDENGLGNRFRSLVARHLLHNADISVIAHPSLMRWQ